MLEIKIPAQKDSKIAHLFHLEISLCSWDIGKSILNISKSKLLWS